MMSAAVGLPIILVNVWFGQIWLTIFVSIIVVDVLVCDERPF